MSTTTPTERYAFVGRRPCGCVTLLALDDANSHELQRYTADSALDLIREGVKSGQVAGWLIQGDATHVPLADGCVDMVFTSPPYSDCRDYGIGAKRGCDEWIEWMLNVVTELTRVCRGLVLVNCAGVTRDRNYWPACEGLMYEWWKRGGNLWRPAYWHRVGIPGSGGRQWLRADIEYVIPFKRDAEWLPWADNTANGHPPKWGPGGEMSHRRSDGARVNQWGKNGSPRGMGNKNEDGTVDSAIRPSHVQYVGPFGAQPSQAGRRENGKHKPPYFNGNSFRVNERRADGTRAVDLNNRLERGNEKGGLVSSPPVLANPGVLVRGISVGGGVLGSKLSHENEAPFPEKLAEWFIRSWCPPGGICFDPFSGSATTVAACRRLGRRAIGMDLRWSQCELGARRLAEPERKEKVRKPKPVAGEAMLFDVIGGAA